MCNCGKKIITKYDAIKFADFIAADQGIKYGVYKSDEHNYNYLPLSKISKGIKIEYETI